MHQQEYYFKCLRVLRRTNFAYPFALFAVTRAVLLSASLVPPHVPSCEVPSSVFVGLGLELLCKDKLSVPPATYRWYKDNKALTATADTAYSIDTKKGTLVSTHANMQIISRTARTLQCTQECSYRHMYRHTAVVLFS